jgi:hypothetical protein
MKMVCINNKYDSGEIIDGITRGKIYIMSPYEGYNFTNIDDRGNTRLWLDDMGLFFMPIDEWRELQLNKLNIWT